MSLKDTLDNLFDGLALPDPTNENNPLTIEQQLSAFETIKNEMVNVDKNEIKTIEDKEFIVDILKKMIKIGLDTLEKLAANCKPGSAANYGESFGTAFSAVLGGVKELREAEKMFFDIQMMIEPQLPEKIEDKNVLMSSKDFLKLIETAKKESSLNGIEAKFKVENYNISDAEYREKEKKSKNKNNSTSGTN